MALPREITHRRETRVLPHRQKNIPNAHATEKMSGTSPTGTKVTTECGVVKTARRQVVVAAEARPRVAQTSVVANAQHPKSLTYATDAVNAIQAGLTYARSSSKGTLTLI